MSEDSWKLPPVELTSQLQAVPQESVPHKPSTEHKPMQNGLVDLNLLGLLSLVNLASFLGMTGATDCSPCIPGLHSSAPQGLALGNLQHWLILDSTVCWGVWCS